MLSQAILETLDWEKQAGLVPAVVQNHRSGRVLMLGWMTRGSLERTLATGLVTFWSRSRGRLWVKGETSGNSLRLVCLRADCDADALLVLAEPAGPTCHRGSISCFGDDDLTAFEFLSRLTDIIRARKGASPAESHTARLFRSGLPEIAKKVGEEAVELVVSALQDRIRTVEEAADLVFHLLVFLEARGVTLEEVLEELKSRH